VELLLPECRLQINLNGKNYISKNGLLDLLQRKTNPDTMRYPIIHLKAEDVELAITHTGDYGEDIYSFVNGQHTTQGGTHQAAFREAYVKVIRDFFKKDYEASDVRQSICAAISVRVQEPVFESQTKTKLGSQYMSEGGPSMKSFMLDFLAKELDNYLHKNPAVADALKKRIEQSERERKELSGIRKLANERAKKANLHNKKLRDCRIHLNDDPPTKTKKSLRKSNWKAPSSLPRVTLPVVPSPRAATWKHRRYSACVVSRSTATASPKKWCMRMKSSTCCSMP
jgi:topoisomerase-4 subunit B